MKLIIKRFVTAIAAIALLAAPAAVLVPSVAHADSNVSRNVCKGVLGTDGATAGDTDCSTEDSDNSFSALARKIINVFSIVVGTVSVIMIIIGGFRYIISGGDSGGVTAGKNTILYAIVGLVIVLFAQVIVRFVLSNTATTP